MLVVVDTGAAKVFVADFYGHLLAEIGSLGDPAGVFYKDDILYVADSSRHQIARYRLEFTTDEQEWEIVVGER